MLGQVSNNVTTARAWFERVSAEGAQKTPYDAFVLDAFTKADVKRSSDINDESLGKVAQKLGISTDGLLSAMSGRCPFGGGMAQAQAKQAQ